MLLFVGLGNPGRQHARNRHNIGFMAIEEIARQHGFAPFRTRFQGRVSEGRFGSDRAILLLPETYMNESGRSVQEAARFYKLELADVVVFHDELDLAPGKCRVKVGGGAAGHNGLRSIDQHLGQTYKRVRLGIGHPGDKALVHSYVLNDFAKSEEGWVSALCDAVARNAGLLARGEDASFQNRTHLAMEAAGFSEPKRVGEK
ncbi:MAG: aminoacyl-tRNA hydrolase [Hyphomicrobiales bacterium]|nr:aminoacyl-tRNA hydrolase [Hyphomicrobiales bacterium]